MTGNVILTVSGTQMDLGEDASTEIIVAADYYYRGGKHYVVYDEADPDNGGEIGNTIKIADGKVEVFRHGAGRVHMIFEEDKQNMTCYHTPVGDMMMDIYTNDISITEAPESIETNINYTLRLNNVFISKCSVRIKIMSKDSADLHILDRKR